MSSHSTRNVNRQSLPLRKSKRYRQCMTVPPEVVTQTMELMHLKCLEGKEEEAWVRCIDILHAEVPLLIPRHIRDPFAWLEPVLFELSCVRSSIDDSGLFQALREIKRVTPSKLEQAISSYASKWFEAKLYEFSNGPFPFHTMFLWNTVCQFLFGGNSFFCIVLDGSTSGPSLCIDLTQ